MIAGGNNALLLDACSHLLAAVFTAAFAGNKTTASRQNLRLRYSYRLRTGIRIAKTYPAMREEAWLLLLAL
jgi:hypothetical protein